MQWSLRDAKEADFEGMVMVYLSCLQKMLCTGDEAEYLMSTQSRKIHALLISNGHCIAAEERHPGIWVRGEMLK